MENRAFNIKATSICPGIIWTESTLQSLEKEGLNEKALSNDKTVDEQSLQDDVSIK